MAIAVEHFIVELLLTHLILSLVGNHRVFAHLSLTIELCDAFQSVLLRPPFYHVWRVVDVLHVEIALMSEFPEGIEMKFLFG